MVGFSQKSTIGESIKEEKKEDIGTHLFSDPKNLYLPSDPLDNCITEVEDLSQYFSDSFLDLDSWYLEENLGAPSMADFVTEPVNAVGGELGDSKEIIEVVNDVVCKRGEVKQEFAGEEVGLKEEKEVEKIIEVCSVGVCENVAEKEGFSGHDSTQDLGGLGCLIEEKLGKVSLDGALMKPGESVDSESESESSSSSSSDDEDDDTSQGNKSNKEDSEVEDGEIMLSDADDLDDDVGGNRPIKSKNELQVLPPVPPVSVTLEPHHQTLPVGVILSVIESQIIVEGAEKHNPLSEGSILWVTESRTPLGIVDEIFGPVKNPYYIVRYNSETEVPSGIQQGTLISFVQEFADHVLNDKNLYQKGYDASNENDEELSDDLEFSDDEKEAEYRRQLKMKKRGTNESKPGNNRKERRQQKNQKVNWNRNEENKLPVITEDQQIKPPVGASLNQDIQAMGHPFPQPDFSARNGVWGNGFPYQQHSMNMTGLAPDGMAWMQQNLPYQLYQNPLQMMQGLPLNFNAMGGQPNFCGGPSQMPLPMGQGQIVVNPLQFGMGLQGQHNVLHMNAGIDAQVQSQGSQNLNFNQGSGGGRGGRSGLHRGRGRGRFSGGRGRGRQY